MKKIYFFPLLLLLGACNLSGPVVPDTDPTPTLVAQDIDLPTASQQVVPQEARWGIYRLELETQAVVLIYDSPISIPTLDLNRAGDRLVFSQKTGGESDSSEEIFTIRTDGSNLRRITNNDFRDLYPVWSPDGSQIAFLSMRTTSLGIYVMNNDGSENKSLYDSSAHEADIDWRGDQIAFTKDSRIWIMQSDGTNARPITNPPMAGEWGRANLPFGDYDPRISPDGTKVIFERLVDDQSSHGNYDLFMIDAESFTENQLTHSGYSQGLASWSNSGDWIVYIVAAVGDDGQYDLYLMKVDGSENRNITPAYFPPQFLCRWAVFSHDDSAIYFSGEWWPLD